MDLTMLLGLQNDPSLMYNVGAFLVGLGLHVGKKCYMEKVSLRDYLNQHKANTYLSMGSLMGAMTYMQTAHPGAPILMYALAGYCIDSVMNKTPLSAARLEKEVKAPKAD